MDFAAFIQDCEAKIRAGEGHKVARQLSALQNLKVPRQFRLPLANICRRTGLFTRGLTFLTPIVSPHRASAEPATALELAEYGVLLLRCGALHEAQSVLHKVDRRLAPEADLYEAFCHLTNWESKKAVPLLESYQRANLTSYARLVGNTNLSIALVRAGRSAEALDLLTQTIEQAVGSKSVSLQSSCLALRAEIYTRTERYALARQDLELAHGLFGTSQTNDQFRVTKWLMILGALETKNVNALKDLYPLAERNYDWETLREADLYSLKLKFHRARFLHLIFGTPFDEFRERVFGEIAPNPERHTYVLGPKNAPRLDLETGMVDGRALLAPGTKIHQVLNTLMRDFYRPLRIGGLFAELFPGEHFDIFSSPDRVHQLLRRTRRWFEGENFPLEIKAKRGFYSLEFKGEFSMRTQFDHGRVDAQTLRWNKLAQAYKATDIFSAKEARAKLGMTKRTFQQLLTWGLEEGKLERLGATKVSAQYKIAA